MPEIKKVAKRVRYHKKIRHIYKEIAILGSKIIFFQNLISFKCGVELFHRHIIGILK